MPVRVRPARAYQIVAISLGVTACGARQSPPAGADSADFCRDFERDVERKVGTSSQTELGALGLSVGKKVEQSSYESVDTKRDTVQKVWADQRELACRDWHDRGALTKSSFNRVASCLDDMLMKFQTTQASKLSETDRAARLTHISDEMSSCRREAVFLAYSENPSQAELSARVLLGQVDVNSAHGDLEDALGTANVVLEQLEGSDNHALRLDAMLAKAEVLREMQRYDEGIDEVVQARRLSKAAGYALGEARASQTEARIYHSQRKVAEAASAYKVAIRTLEQADLKDDVLKAHLLIGLGSITDDSKQALATCERALEVRGDQSYETRLVRAAAWNCIAGAHLNAERYDEALLWYQKSLAALRELLGDGHPDTATTAAYIGRALFNKKNYQSALSYFAPALNVLLQGSGGSGQSMLEFQFYFGASLILVGDFETAVIVLDRGALASERSLGAAHPLHRLFVRSLGAANAYQRRFLDAQRLFSRVLAMYQGDVPVDEADVAESMIDVAGMLVELNDYERAFDLYRQAIANLTGLKDRDEDLLLYARAAQASAACRAGQGSTLKLLSELVEKQKKRSGDFSTETADVMTEVGMCVLAGASPADALAWFQGAARRYQRDEGGVEPDIVFPLYEIGRLCNSGVQAACQAYAALNPAQAPR